MTTEADGQPAGLRARAERCRAFAREYATDVGVTLSELAAELDRKADRLEAKDGTEIADPVVAPTDESTRI